MPLRLCLSCLFTLKISSRSLHSQNFPQLPHLPFDLWSLLFVSCITLQPLFSIYIALVASSLAKFVTSRSLLNLWFMPLNILITFIIGSVLGWLLKKFTKAPKCTRGMILGSCAADILARKLVRSSWLLW